MVPAREGLYSLREELLQRQRDSTWRGEETKVRLRDVKSKATT